MPKLYFRYGAMGAAKSLNLLAVAHNYRSQGKKVFLIQPQAGARERGFITSRSGLREQCDFCPDAGNTLSLGRGWDCVLVDEAQFLSPRFVDCLRHMTIDPGVPVICYGLLRDFNNRLFPGSQRLIELVDSIEEIKTTCTYCHRKATQNLRLIGGDQQLQIGDAEYAPACWGCYREKRSS